MSQSASCWCSVIIFKPSIRKVFKATTTFPTANSVDFHAHTLNLTGTLCRYPWQKTAKNRGGFSMANTHSALPASVTRDPQAPESRWQRRPFAPPHGTLEPKGSPATSNESKLLRALTQVTSSTSKNSLLKPSLPKDRTCVGISRPPVCWKPLTQMQIS